MLNISENKHKGIIIEENSLPKTKESLHKQIADIIDLYGHKKLLWITIPIEKSDFIPVLTNLNFEFHHCDETKLILVKKIHENALVPTSKNFIVGVAAIVIENNKLLVVKDMFSRGYKLPGGHVEKQEYFKDALIREVYEETGIEISFESIINIGHFKQGQFGEANIYIVCTAHALTTEISIKDTDEIVEAAWIDVSEFLKSKSVNNYNKTIVKAFMNNAEHKLTEHDIDIQIPGEVFF
ncbi:MAG: NUDIX domain-containing protein [Bacteroidota bacterium]